MRRKKRTYNPRLLLFGFIAFTSFILGITFSRTVFPEAAARQKDTSLSRVNACEETKKSLLGVLTKPVFGKASESANTNLYKSDLTNPTLGYPKRVLKKATLTPAAIPTIPSGFCLRVPILYYHHVQPEATAQERGQTNLTVDNGIFDHQMQYLSDNGYTTLSVDSLVNALLSHSQLPPKSILVTLDDGYLDVYTYAFPIFQKYHITANVMIPTGLLGGKSSTNEYMTWDNLKQMVNSGQVFASDHTWSHYAVGGGTEEKDQYEIMTAKQQLEQNLGKSITTFTYPYGSGQALPRVEALLIKDGFKAAFSTLPGSYQCDSAMFDLRRLHVGNTSLSYYGL